MDALKRFTIPLKGIKTGVNRFNFDIDSDFFTHFEGTPIKEGQFTVILDLDKRPEMLVLDFEFEGKTGTNCDRCLAGIQMPVNGTNQLVVKFSEQDSEEDEEIIYLPWDTPELNVASYIFENIVLALPLINIYDCKEDEVAPCDFEMLKYLDAENAEPAVEDSNTEAADNPIWSELKKKFNNDN